MYVLGFNCYVFNSAAVLLKDGVPVAAAQQERFRTMLLYGSGAMAVISLIMPLLHIGVALAIPLVLIAHMIAVRVVLIRDTRRLLGTTRRIFTRWISRFSFVWLGIPGYGLTTIPVFGVVAGVATFAGLTALVHYYTIWSLRRERQRQQLAVWETALLTGFVVLTVVLVVLAIGLALLLGLSVAKIMEVIQFQM